MKEVPTDFPSKARLFLDEELGIHYIVIQWHPVQNNWGIPATLPPFLWRFGPKKIFIDLVPPASPRRNAPRQNNLIGRGKFMTMLSRNAEFVPNLGFFRLYPQPIVRT